MAEKRVNPLLIAGVVIAVVCLSLVMCSDRTETYQPVDAVPGFDEGTMAQDGDTQADTIRALQAYAREAVRKADELNASTQDSMEKVLDNENNVLRLERESEEAKSDLAETQVAVGELETRLLELNRELSELRRSNTQFNADGLPVGFGFDGAPQNVSQGAWYDSIDFVDTSGEGSNRGGFSGLISGPTRRSTAASTGSESSQPEMVVEPVYTIPKDATLTDGLALTALVGRIPVDGQTPDPYPVKIYVGRENLLANGHDIPEVEGMIFSGLGFGDWNLTCVSARLSSATFIFEDGSIVNHSSQNQALGYISEPDGFPCVEGTFETNAPAFLTQRIALAGIGAAGAAYAEAQQQTEISSLTGTSTTNLIGDINKLAAGEAVLSATDEVTEWLLARQQQSFDAVVVEPGAEVSVHLDISLPLDKSSLARKVRYAKDSHSSHYGLD